MTFVKLGKDCVDTFMRYFTQTPVGQECVIFESDRSLTYDVKIFKQRLVLKAVVQNKHRTPGGDGFRDLRTFNAVFSDHGREVRSVQ